MEKIVINIIKAYQYFSGSLFQSKALPLFAPVQCRFHPSCSEYAIEAIKEHGAIKGIAKGVVRVLKCNPLTRI